MADGMGKCLERNGMKNVFTLLVFCICVLSSCSHSTIDIKYPAYVEGCSDVLMDLVMSSKGHNVSVNDHMFIAKACNMKAQEKYSTKDQ
jgi:hypothetical protein